MKASARENQEAIKDYNKAIGIKPQFAVAYCNRGNAKAALNDNPGAIVDYNTPSVRKVDAFLFKLLGGLMEQINASIQRGCSG